MKANMGYSDTDPTPNPSPSWEGSGYRILLWKSVPQALPSLPLGPIGRLLPAGRKKGRGWGWGLSPCAIVMVPGSKLIIRNNGRIHMASGKELNAPKGATVIIESGVIK